MNTPELPPDWDWVKARHECSPAKFFDRLHLQSKANVDQRNLLMPDLGKVEHTTTSQNLFSLARETHFGRAMVRFNLTHEGQIEVQGAGELVGKLNFSGRIVLGDDGRCKLLVGDKALSEWQVLRMALQDLFFRSSV